MRGITHAAIAGLAMYAINPITKYEELKTMDPWFIVGGIIGAYLPDSDHHAAPAGRLLPLHILFKHRTIVHSIFFMVLITGLCCFINNRFAAGIGLGYGLHLLFDNFTPSGEKYLFWPLIIPKRK